MHCCRTVLGQWQSARSQPKQTGMQASLHVAQVARHFETASSNKAVEAARCNHYLCEQQIVCNMLHLICCNR